MRTPLSRWIEDTVWLPIGLSAEPGSIKLAPYVVEIADAIGEPPKGRARQGRSGRSVSPV
jgi:hypothetical protein